MVMRQRKPLMGEFCGNVHPRAVANGREGFEAGDIQQIITNRFHKEYL